MRSTAKQEAHRAGLPLFAMPIPRPITLGNVAKTNLEAPPRRKRVLPPSCLACSQQGEKQ